MILDCFTFFNELDLLDLRLHELNPYVDRFVIAEADHTFQAKPKPFYYYENRHLFSSFDSKIIWVPVRMTKATDSWSPWEREAHQRRAIGRALLMLEQPKDDIVLLSDVDEIPDLAGKTLHQNRPWRDAVGNGVPVVWVHSMTYYWVDLWVTFWRGTIAMKLGDVNRVLNGDFQKLREYRGYNGPLVYPGGWHFSFLGGVDAIKTKIEAFSHTEYRSAADEENLRQAVGERWQRGIDLFGRNIYKFRPLAAEERERLPRYLTDHRARFREFFRFDGQDQGDPESARLKRGATDS